MEHEGKLSVIKGLHHNIVIILNTHIIRTQFFFKWQSTKLHQKRGVLI